MELKGRLSEIDKSGKLNNTDQLELLSNIHLIVGFEMLQ